MVLMGHTQLANGKHYDFRSYLGLRLSSEWVAVARAH